MRREWVGASAWLDEPKSRCNSEIGRCGLAVGGFKLFSHQFCGAGADQTRCAILFLRLVARSLSTAPHNGQVKIAAFVRLRGKCQGEKMPILKVFGALRGLHLSWEVGRLGLASSKGGKKRT